MNSADVIRNVAVLALIAIGTSVASAEPQKLPVRSGSVPFVSSHVPHVQIGVEPVPELSKELLRQVSTFPGLEIRDTVVSLPGALGFWINEDVKLARRDVIIRGREFAHVHPNGSLHATLSPELADRAVMAGWAAHHPWAKKWPRFKGFVMIFTPRSKAELKVVVQLVQASYNFVTGKD